MPTVQPAWFVPETYAGQSVIHMNVTKYEGRWDWDEAGFQQQLARFGVSAWENFEALGNRDNISPNPFFNVQEYCEAVARYSNAFQNEDGSVGYMGSTEWTADRVLANMTQTFHVSAWDHYTQAGQFAGLNPSNAFSTGAYLNQAAAVLNAYVSPQGTHGWEGKSWTGADVQAAYAAAGINPIMAMYTDGNYGQTGGMTPTDVTGAERVTPASPDWTPWGTPIDPFTPTETKTLTTAVETVIGTAGQNTLFKALVGSSTDSTLNQDDIIIGGEGNNTLQVQMYNDFYGFNGQSGGGANLSGVQHVDLINANAYRPETFNAKNTEGVSQWTVDANGGLPVNLTDLPNAGITVNVKNLASGAQSIAFAQDVPPGGELTIGLSKVGTDDSPVALTTAGIEKLTLNADQNTTDYVDVSAINAPALATSGYGAMAITAVNQELKTFDGTASNGGVNVNLSNALAMNSVRGGFGDDIFTLGGNFSPTATIDGGPGLDTVNITGSWMDVAPSWTNVEAIGVDTNFLSLSAANLKGLQQVNLDKADGTATISKINSSAITVQDQSNDNGYSSPTLTLNGTENNGVSALNTVNYKIQNKGTFGTTLNTNAQQDVVLNIAANADANDVPHTSFWGTINAPNARGSLIVNAEGKLGDNGGDATFNVPNAAYLNINAKNGAVATIQKTAENATATITAGNAFLIDDDSDLSNLASLTINQKHGQGSFYSYQNFANLRQLNISGDASTLSGDNVPGVGVHTTLGSTNHTSGLTINAHDLNSLFLSPMDTQGTTNININNVQSKATIGSINAEMGIENKPAGNVTLTASGEGNLEFNYKNDPAGPDIGGEVVGQNITFTASGLQGKVRGVGVVSEDLPENLVLFQAQNLTYNGAQSTDRIAVNVTDSANIMTGKGRDKVVIDSDPDAGKQVNINVNLGGDNDRDWIAMTDPDKGLVIAKVTGFVLGSDHVAKDTIVANTPEAAWNFLSNNLGVTSTISPIEPTSTSESSPALGYFADGTAYFFTGALNLTNPAATEGIGVIAVTSVNSGNGILQAYTEAAS